MSSIQLVNDGSDPFDGDIQVTDNSLTLTEGVERIRQHLQVRFRLFFGEWFLNTELGVPWFRDVLVKNPAFVVVHEVLKGVVLDTPGVLELERFAFEYDNTIRAMSLDFRCLSTDGFIDFTQPVGIGEAA